MSSHLLINLKDIPELQKPHVVIKNPEEVESKIRILIAGGFKELQIVSDFDHTITKQRNDNGKKPLTSFGLLHECESVPDWYKDEASKLFTKYRPYELDETIDRIEKSKILHQWWADENNILKNFRLPPHEFLDAAKHSETTLRDGSKEMIKYLNECNVPVLIFSAGLGNSIMAVLEVNNLILPNVKLISNFIKYKDGDITDGINEPWINVLNKNEQALHETEYYDLVRDRGNVILMGDAMGDAGMADGVPHCNTVLRIGFIYEKAEDILETFTKTFDIVLIDDQTMNVPSAIIHLISKT